MMRGICTAGHPALLVLRASDEELAQHEMRLEDIEKQSGYCLYRQAHYRLSTHSWVISIGWAWVSIQTSVL